MVEASTMMDMKSIQEGMKKERTRGISGSTIKLIAAFIMLIDHTAAVILDRQLISINAMEIFKTGVQGDMTRWMEDNAVLLFGDLFMRLAGRVAFPIFCFLIVEGFQKTSNVKRYLLRLGVFAMVSEIPFDLAISGKWFALEHQNVLFTLFLGLFTICCFEYEAKAGHNGVCSGGLQAMGRIRKGIMIVADFVILVLVMYLASLLSTDYGSWGVLTIVVMYLFRKHKIRSTAMGCLVLSVMSLVEITAFFALIPIALYNGERGRKIKYLFYGFYPVHLLVLYLICVVMGLGKIVPSM